MSAHAPIARSVRDLALDAINAVEMASERPTRMRHSTFTLWEAMSGGKANPIGTDAETLELVERLIAREHFHGKTILALQHDALTDCRTLHTYRIRKGKAIGWDRDARRTYAYTADRLFSVEVEAFAPVEPWRCLPGADRVGTSNVIEVRS